MTASPDGTLWAHLGYRSGLARRVDGEWELLEQVEGASYPRAWTVGRDGTLWLGGRDANTDECTGLQGFDGETWRRYLPNLCVYSADVSPDGTVWFRAGMWDEWNDPDSAGAVDLYAIRPSGE